MKISKIELGEVNIPLVVPFKTALRTVSTVNDIIVKIITDTGEIGYGEAPPTAVITGDTKGSIVCAIKDFIAPSIIGMDISDFEEIMLRMHSCIVRNTSAKAAIDMALYDLYAQHQGQPLYKLLGGAKKSFETDITISVNDIPTMVEDSLTAVGNGFNILKVKVGKEGMKDIERISSIRKEVGNDVIIRVDANQGWEANEAIHIIKTMEDKGLNIELVEQPVKAQDFEGMRNITNNVDTKILADESVFSYRDAVKIITNHAADLINIKLMKTGGIYEALKICDIAEKYDVECMIGCMLESKISVSAASHLAAGRKIVTMADLDGPSLCSEDPYEGGPAFENNKITMNDSPGIGITNIYKVKWGI